MVRKVVAGSDSILLLVSSFVIHLISSLFFSRVTTKKNNEYLGIVVKQGQCHQHGSYIFLRQSPFLHLFFVNDVEIEEVEEDVEIEDVEEDVSAHLDAIQETMNQLLVSQNEMQEEMFSLVDLSVEEECKRLEEALAAKIERTHKSDADDLFARILEETAGQENPMRDLPQQIENVLTSFITENLGPTMWKAMMPSPEEIHALTSSLEETVSSSFTQSLIAHQSARAEQLISKIFPFSSRQSFKRAATSAIEGSLLPCFERSCETMFGQVVSAFQAGMAEHTRAAAEQQRFDLDPSLKERITEVSSVVKAARHVIAESQWNRLANHAGGYGDGYVDGHREGYAQGYADACANAYNKAT